MEGSRYIVFRKQPDGNYSFFVNGCGNTYEELVVFLKLMFDERTLSVYECGAIASIISEEQYEQLSIAFPS